MPNPLPALSRVDVSSAPPADDGLGHKFMVGARVVVGHPWASCDILLHVPLSCPGARAFSLDACSWT